MKHFDVAIIGYGPTGAMMAYLLGRQGISTLVVEPNVAVYEIPRAVHYDGEIQRIFQSVGMIDELKEFSREAGLASFLNGVGWSIFKQDFQKTDKVHHWANSYFFSQVELEKRLRSRVSRCDSVELELGSRLETIEEDEKGITLTVTSNERQQSRVFHCTYLLGCDGANSHTRQLGDFALQDLGCEEPWLVCDLMLDKKIDIDGHIYQICDPRRPVSLIPCEKGHIRWEFMLNKTDDHTDLENERTVRAMMAPHIGRLNPEITSQDGDLVRSKVYRFHALLADKFKCGRVFLLGDAAHQMPPFLGQGLCSGIRDAYNLSWKLGGVLTGQWDAKILETYHSERHTHTQAVTKLAIMHGDIIQTRNYFKAFARDLFLLLGRVIPVLTAAIKFGQQWRLGKGLFAEDKGGLNRFMLRQAMIQLNNGEHSLLDDLLSDSFNAIGFNTDVDALMREQNSDFIGTPVACLNLGDHGHGIDAQGRLQRWADTHQVAIAILRPDRQIFGLCYRHADESLESQLEQLMSELKAQLR